MPRSQPKNGTVSSSEPPEERKVAGSIPALATEIDVFSASVPSRSIQIRATLI
jgi:hypothetical protein